VIFSLVFKIIIFYGIVFRAAKTENKKSGDDGKSLGVLYTGYLDKRNPVTGTLRQRFVVLTNDQLHWFKRSEGYDLFGEERGQIPLGNILTTRVLDEDDAAFEVQGTDAKKRMFRAMNAAMCEEWVSAIRSAIKLSTTTNNKRGANRRSSLAGIKNFDLDDANNENNDASEVSVLLMSLVSVVNQTEVVIARKPDWNRIIVVPNLGKGDQILLSTSNGGIVRLLYDTIINKAQESQECEYSVQNVTLASSLKITLAVDNVIMGGGGSKCLRKSGPPTTMDMIIDMANTLSSERNTAINLVLSMMVLVVAMCSLRSVGIDTTLLFLFATLLSLYNCKNILQRVYAGESDAHKKVSIRIILNGHTFTSPDAPVKEVDDEIPQRFIDGYGRFLFVRWLVCLLGFHCSGSIF
jgi:hypothetical protein